MEESSPSKLQDSLDLAALSLEIVAEQERQQAKPKYRKYFGIGLLALMGLLVLAVVGGIFSATFTSGVFSVIYVLGFALGIGYFAFLTIMAYRYHQIFAKRFNAYAPSFVPRATFYDTIRVLQNWPLIILAIVFVAPFPDFLTLVVGLGIISIIGYYQYKRLLLWIYQGGAQRIDQWLKYFPHNDILLNSKTVSDMNAGRLDEAEQLLRKILRHRARNVYRIPLEISNLGYCLMLKENYADALPLLESAVNISPTLSNMYGILACWYLEQKRNAQRAVELSEMALALCPPENLPLAATYKTICAWALALTGQNARAETLTEQVLQNSESFDAPTRAEIYYQIGQARLVLGDKESAVEHFQKAIEIAPNSLDGKLARRALDRLAPPP